MELLYAMSVDGLLIVSSIHLSGSVGATLYDLTHAEMDELTLARLDRLRAFLDLSTSASLEQSKLLEPT
jgi:hypothetical protein